MNLPSPKLRFRAEVRHHTFEDGLVVYVVETCETHLLERAWSDALAAGDMAPMALGNGDLGEQNLAMTASHVQSLIDLKILDPVS